MSFYSNLKINYLYTLKKLIVKIYYIILPNLEKLK